MRDLKKVCGWPTRKKSKNGISPLRSAHQCFGSALDPHSMGSWIRIRIANASLRLEPFHEMFFFEILA
jgi:hypothetical protein